MKTLCVYYSRTGNTRKVAEEIATILHSEIEEIIDKKNRSGVMGWILGGRDGMGKKLTKIEKIKSDLLVYDLIILGCPIWVSLPPAMRAFIKEQKQNVKKVAFFCTMGGSGYQNMFQEMELLSERAPIATIAITDKEIQTGKYKSIVAEFIKEMKP